MRRRPAAGSGAWRFAVLIVLGLYFVVPIAASVLFTVRTAAAAGSPAEHYAEIPASDGLRRGVHPLADPRRAHRRPRAGADGADRRPGGTAAAAAADDGGAAHPLPLVLPPIALVVGVRSVLSWAPDYFLNTPLARGVLRPPGAVAAVDPGAGLRGPGPAVRLPRAGRRGARRRPAHAHRGRPQPRRLLAAGARVRRPAGAAHVGAQRLVPDLRAGAGRVHDRRRSSASRPSRRGS